MEARRTFPLFASGRERGIAAAVLLLIFVAMTGWDYLRYRTIADAPLVAEGTVTRSYLKHSSVSGRLITVMRISTDAGFDLVTVRPGRSAPLGGHRVSVRTQPLAMTFVDFYRGVFVRDLVLTDHGAASGVRASLSAWIASQHDSAMMRELFGALFLDEAMGEELQQKVSLFGLAAILSLSGLNVGILSAMLLFVLSPLYRAMQDRYFPYRHRQKDLAMVVIGAMIGYLAIVDMMPSFLRAVAMLIAGTLLYMRRIDVMSFESLGLITAILVAFDPALIVSIGFWFSVAGVYMIYLYLAYWGGYSRMRIYVGLSVWIYFAMLPIIHAVFDQFSWAQLSSPLTSMAFDLFYPVTVILHLLGIGGIADGMIGSLLSLPATPLHLSAPLWFAVLYVMTALAASRIKEAFWTLNVLMGVFFGMGLAFAV